MVRISKDCTIAVTLYVSFAWLQGLCTGLSLGNREERAVKLFFAVFARPGYAITAKIGEVANFQSEITSRIRSRMHDQLVSWGGNTFPRGKTLCFTPSKTCALPEWRPFKFAWILSCGYNSVGVTPRINTDGGTSSGENLVRIASVYVDVVC